MKKLAARTLAVLAAAGSVAALPVGAATADTAKGEPHVSINTVLDGKVAGLMGNQHRVTLDTMTWNYSDARNAA